MSEKKSGWFEKADHVIVTIFKGLSQLSCAFLIGIMIVAFFNVLGEKIFHHGIPMSTELITYFHVPVVFCAVSYVTMDPGHTRIDLLSSRLPAGLQKVILIIGDLIGCGICVFVAYQGILRMNLAIERHTRSSTTGAGFHIWPFILIFVIGFILLSISFLWHIVRLCHDRGDRPKPTGFVEGEEGAPAPANEEGVES